MSSYYCRLCMTCSDPEECTIFSKTITDMINFCMPEINVKLVNNPILCGACKKMLEKCTKFKKKCIDVQNHIEKFKETNRGTLDLALISAVNGTETPQSPVPNTSFDESYRKFLALNNTESAADSNDAEVSKIMNKTKEEIRRYDEFLDLLESSTNIKKARLDNNEKVFENNGNWNNHDASRGKSSMATLPSNAIPKDSQSELSKETPLSKTTSISNPINDTFPSKQIKVTSPTKPSKELSRCKTPKIPKTIPVKPKTPIPEIKKQTTLHHISNPFNARIENTKCLTCQKDFFEVHKLVAHLYSIHQKSDELYPCLLCRYKVKSGRTIRKHFLMFHDDCVNLHGSCPACQTHMPDVKSLQEHIRAEHKDISSSDRFRCNVCSFRTSSIPSFKRHFLQNHDLVCNYCKQEVENTEYMNRHIRCHYFGQRKQMTLSEDPLEFVEVKVEEDPLS